MSFTAACSRVIRSAKEFFGASWAFGLNGLAMVRFGCGLRFDGDFLDKGFRFAFGFAFGFFFAMSEGYHISSGFASTMFGCGIG